MTMPAHAAPASVAIVDLYVTRGRLRAEIPMLGFGRLSDLFNNAPGEFIGASMTMASTANEAGVVRRDLVVRLHDVRLVRPIEERSGPVLLAARRERIQARVVIDLDDWQVTGDVHLVDRIRWLDYATAIQNRFISVSNASIRFVGVAEPLECEYMLVNGARITALYEVA
jgi:hypothetical protein